VRITAIAASYPMSCQLGATTVRTMSAASMNSRPSISQRANSSHASRRAPWVAWPLSRGQSDAYAAYAPPIAITSTDSPSSARAIGAASSLNIFSMAAPYSGRGADDAAEAEV
jgi:hypothetical protein